MSDFPYELDAREILRYLNELGIRNITADVLRDFISDLKKFIKYDMRCRNQNIDYNDMCIDLEGVEGPERLHTASTFSSRCRTKSLTDLDLKKCCGRRISQNPSLKGGRGTSCKVRMTNSAPATFTNRRADTNSCTCRCTCVQEKVEEKQSKNIKLTTSSSNFIRVPVKLPQKKHDPVALYHYYRSVWDKYKPNLPGQNNWADLRWTIRQKLAGDKGQTLQRKISKPTDKELEVRRKGWKEK